MLLRQSAPNLRINHTFILIRLSKEKIVPISVLHTSAIQTFVLHGVKMLVFL